MWVHVRGLAPLAIGGPKHNEAGHLAGMYMRYIWCWPFFSLFEVLCYVLCRVFRYWSVRDCDMLCVACYVEGLPIPDLAVDAVRSGDGTSSTCFLSCRRPFFSPFNHPL